MPNSETMDTSITLLCSEDSDNETPPSSVPHHGRRSLPLIRCPHNSDPSLNAIDEDGCFLTVVTSLDNSSRSQPSSPVYCQSMKGRSPSSPLLCSPFKSARHRSSSFCSPSSPQNSLGTSPMSSTRSLSPAAFSRIMRTPSPVRIARDGTQPRHGSISDMRHIGELVEDDEEVDMVMTSLGSSWGHRSSLGSLTKSQPSPGSLTNHRSSLGSLSSHKSPVQIRACRIKARNRPPTPPPLCTEVAAVSQQLTQLGIKDKFRIPDRDFSSVHESFST